VSPGADRLAAGPVGAVWRSAPVRRVRRLGVREPANAVLHGRHEGRRAFVFGNGPSILQQDLTLLRDEVTFGLNSFFLHERFEDIAPTYLCSLDPMALDADYRRRWAALHEERGTRGAVKLFSQSARRVDRELGLFPGHECHYLLAASPLLPPLSELDTCPVDLTRPLAGHGLVLTDIALLAAYAMGVERIYLLGFDAQPIRSLKDYLNYNFYGKDPLISMAEYERDYERFFAAQDFQDTRENLLDRTAACLKRTFAARGVEVLNATHGGGHLPGFDRVALDDVL